ncbi:MAG: hypothetical protein SVO01_00155 [Thermotogota bacterium]|nr:hypothetical protein [Thermotogota bacterium]
MPRKNFKNIGALQSYEYLAGVIVGSPDADDDTCTVLIGASEYEDVPIFYHCDPDAAERENGAIVGAASGFSDSDNVIILEEKGGDKLFVIAHIDGARHCHSGFMLCIKLWDYDNSEYQYLYYNVYQGTAYNILSPVDGSQITQPFTDADLTALGTDHASVISYNGLDNYTGPEAPRCISNPTSSDPAPIAILSDGDDFEAPIYSWDDDETTQRLADEVDCTPNGDGTFIKHVHYWWLYTNDASTSGSANFGDSFSYLNNDYQGSTTYAGEKTVVNCYQQGFEYYSNADTCSAVSAPVCPTSVSEYTVIYDANGYVKLYASGNLNPVTKILNFLPGSNVNKDDSKLVDLLLVNKSYGISMFHDYLTDDDNVDSSCSASMTKFSGDSDSLAGAELDEEFRVADIEIDHSLARIFVAPISEQIYYAEILRMLSGITTVSETGAAALTELKKNTVMLSDILYGGPCSYNEITGEYDVLFSNSNLSATDLSGVYSFFGTTQAARITEANENMGDFFDGDDTLYWDQYLDKVGIKIHAAYDMGE